MRFCSFNIDNCTNTTVVMFKTGIIQTFCSSPRCFASLFHVGPPVFFKESQRGVLRLCSPCPLWLFLSLFVPTIQHLIHFVKKDFLINFQIILLYFVGHYIFVNFLNYFSRFQFFILFIFLNAFSYFCCFFFSTRLFNHFSVSS